MGILAWNRARLSPVSLLVSVVEEEDGPEHHVKRLGRERFLTKVPKVTIPDILGDSEQK